MNANRHRATLTERLTDLRAEKRLIEYRKSQGKPVTVHHERALEMLEKKITQYEKDLYNLPAPGPYTVWRMRHGG